MELTALSCCCLVSGANEIERDLDIVDDPAIEPLHLLRCLVSLQHTHT